MKSKKTISIIAIVACVVIFIVFKVITKDETISFMEVIEQSSEPGKPFVVESLIYGTSTNRSQIENDIAPGYIQLTENEIKELLDILSTTTLEPLDIKNFKLIPFWEEPSSDYYTIKLSNRGYTMSYDVQVSLDIKPDNEQLVIWIPAAGQYLTDDFRILDKLKELYALPREN